jgi:hypothetical protein
VRWITKRAISAKALIIGVPDLSDADLQAKVRAELETMFGRSGTAAAVAGGGSDVAVGPGPKIHCPPRHRAPTRILYPHFLT